MKIAVTSIGETIDSPLDQRFGRARYFLVHDTEDGSWATHSNEQNFDAIQGAGILSAKKIIDLNAGILITGHCGPKAFQALSAGNVEIYQNAAGTVREAVDMYLSGRMAAAKSPNVNSHFRGGN
jgi:predicted Fe-Mo cluster-binding NifX family protein